MAESNQRKFAEPIELDDQDPFAELTRIMGFDPRVAARAPAKENPAAAANEDAAPPTQTAPGGTAAKVTPLGVVPAAARALEPAAPQAVPVRDDVGNEDFGIDLEKELLGEFAEFEFGPAIEPLVKDTESFLSRSAAPQAVRPAPARDDFENAFEDAFATLDGDAPKQAEPAPAAVAIAQNGPANETHAVHDDFDFGDIDFDEPAPPRGVVQVPAPDQAPPSVAVRQPAPAVDRSFDDIDFDEPAAPPSQNLAVASQPAVEPAVDLYFEDIDFDAPAAPPSSQSLAVAPQPAVQPEADVDLNFDEIDFDGPNAPQATAAPAKVEEPEPLLDLDFDDADFAEPVRQAVTAREAAETAPVSSLGEPKLDFDFGAIDFEEPAQQQAAQPADTEPAPARHPTPAAAEAPVHHGLAEVDMDFSAAFDREFADEEARQVVAVDDPTDIWNAQPVEQVPEAEAGESLELSLEEELDALLSEDHAEPAHDAQPAPRPVHVPFSYDPRWAELEADEEHAPARPQSFQQQSTPPSAVEPAVQRRPFSDPSLIARHASFQAPARATDDLDDLLEAMEHEVHAPPSLAPEPPQDDANGFYDIPQERYGGDISRQSVPDEDSRGPDADVDEAPMASSGNAAPDIETIDVPETAIVIAHDLDIPELDYQHDKPRAVAYDDIDADFAAAFHEDKPREEPVNHIVRDAARPTERADIDADLEAFYQPSHAAGARSPSQESVVVPFQPAAGYRHEAVRAPEHDDADAAPSAAGRDRFMDFDFDSDQDEEPAQAYVARSPVEQPQRRGGLLIAAVVGGVALLGGVGAWALSYGGGDGTEAPALVKADDSPIKVKPENPGGTTVPNQDNKVYDAVKGTATATETPTQEKLVTTSEEPVDMAAAAENGALPGVNADEDIPQTAEAIVPKADDRIAAAVGEEAPAEDGAVVAPRRVKTMIVRADGTLVPREDPAPAGDQVAAVSDDNTGAVPAAGNTATAGAQQPVETAAPTAGSEAPEASALPPAKKAETATETVAAAEPAPTAVATGAWSVQIASQPSAESAKASYEDLARRYAGVIGGKGVNIVKAEIAGKGTYWRVRVPAQTRDEAVKLCNDYKAAGGNCFISK